MKIKRKRNEFSNFKYLDKCINLLCYERKSPGFRASENTSRYSFKAILKLKQYGHQVFAFGKKVGEVREITVKTIFPNHKKRQHFNLLELLNQKDYYERISALKPNRII